MSPSPKARTCPRTPKSRVRSERRGKYGGLSVKPVGFRAGPVLKSGRGQGRVFEFLMKISFFKFSITFLAWSLMQMVCSRGAVNLRVGGFSEVRSGNISIGEGAYFDEARAFLQTNYNAVFTNLDVLTDTNLAGVKLLILAPGTSHASGATPLSTNEQSAMVHYVLGGGGLLILSDNYSYAG